MRILRFMGYPINNFSTLERMVLTQAAKLKALGHDLELAFDGVKCEQALRDAKRCFPEVRIHTGLTFPGSGIGLLSKLRYATNAAQMIREGKFDVVHLYFEPSAPIMNQVARLFPSVKFVRTIGSTPLPLGSRRYLDGIKRKKWVLNLRQLDRIICVGEHISEMLESYGVQRERLTVIPNAIDTTHFRRRQPHRRGTILRMAFIGRLEHVKNVELLIRGTALAVHKYGRRDLALTLYGEGSLKPSLERLVETESLVPYVKFAGPTNNVADILNNDVDVYVQASFNEGCSASVMEAMACEVPLVLSDIKGHKQVADPISHASYFPSDDADSFAQNIINLANNFDEYRHQTVLARAHVVSKFGLDAWVRRELELYVEMLELRAPGTEGRSNINHSS